jgi:hypothetical protein
MSLALWRKEGWEHRGAGLLLTLVFGPLLMGLQWVQRERSLRGSPFLDLKLTAALLCTLGALFVAHRLIVREYGQHTQLFLESLPLSRPRILATKLVLGAGVLLLLLALHVLVLWSQARTHEDVTARFLGLVLLRTGSVVLLGWSFFALAGLVGRYRNPLYLGLLIALFAADHLTDFELIQSPPLRLLGQDFAFERQHAPWEALRACWAATAALTGLGFGLVLYRDGTLTELLSQRMSHREKVFIACVVLGLVWLVSTLGDARQRQPFDLAAAQRATVKNTSVQVAPGVGFEPERAQALAERLAQDLDAMARELALERLPPVAVVLSGELDADVFQRAELERADGVVVRANLSSPRFDPRAFEAFLFREVLIAHSEGTVLRESRRWLLDGYTTWWALRGEPARLSAEGAVGAREDFDEREWSRVRERLGPCGAGAVAARGIQVLHDALGAESFQAAMRRLLALRPSTGFWGLWHEPRLDAVLRERGGLSEEELRTRWRLALKEDHAAHAGQMAWLDGLRPTLTRVAESSETFRLEHALRGEAGTRVPPRYALLYHALEPFETEVAQHAFSRQDTLTSPEGARLPQGLARGERWLFVMQVEGETSGCPLRLLSRREDIR